MCLLEHYPPYDFHCKIFQHHHSPFRNLWNAGSSIRYSVGIFHNNIHSKYIVHAIRIQKNKLLLTYLCLRSWEAIFFAFVSNWSFWLSSVSKMPFHLSTTEQCVMAERRTLGAAGRPKNNVGIDGIIINNCTSMKYFDC